MVIELPYPLIAYCIFPSRISIHGMTGAEENRKCPTTLQEACADCKIIPRNLDKMVCYHFRCLPCQKKLGAPFVEGKKLVVACPACDRPFSSFWHTDGQSYTFYKKGFGVKGKLKNHRHIGSESETIGGMTLSK